VTAPTGRCATTVALDATVVIHLARAKCLAALGAIEDYDFVVTEQVVEVALYADLCQRMGRGEAASLAMAVHRGWRLASDDRGRGVLRLVQQRVENCPMM